MFLESFISTINGQGLKDSIRKVSQEICDNVNKHFDFRNNISGLLLGNVQSGKTSQMLGAIARFADEGYRIFIILTSDNVDLQRQTYLRTANALKCFDVLSEKDDAAFNARNMSKPLILVLKKNSRILRKWRDLLLSSSYCKGQFLIIFDDEADNASLNTLVNKQRTSEVNKNIDEIRKSASSSIYIEVTATPQSLILQSSMSKWRPEFVNYFKPGKGYLGGDFFYADPKPYCIRFTQENELDDVTVDDDNYCPKGLQDSIIFFLVVCAHKELNAKYNCNFMVHPSIRTCVHSKFALRIEEHLNLLQRAKDDESFVSNIRRVWTELQQTKPDLESFEDIEEKVSEILDNMKISVYTLNSKSIIGRDPQNADALNLSEGFNIVVGGNTLGRGITFPHLQIVYYCRASKVPQADTFWQHSRIFGYDREAELVRIFIPKSLYQLFCNLNKANSVLIQQIKTRGLDGIELIYPNGIKPTRQNVLDNKYLHVLAGGVNMFPQDPFENNTKEIDSIVAPYKEKNISKVNESLILQILKHVGSYRISDFDSQRFSDCIQALAKKRPKVQFTLIVRYNRGITKGTGTLLSPTDRTLGDQYAEDIVLTLYRVNGSKEKGWNGSPLWIPNIKFPSDCCFYTTD